MDQGDLVEKHQQPVAEIVEDSLIDLGVGRSQALAQRQDDLPGKPARRLHQLQERLSPDISQFRLGECRRAGAARQAVEQRHFADHLALFGEIDRGLAAVLGGQVDANDAGNDDVEPVGFVSLIEQNRACRQGLFAGDPGKTPELVVVEPVEEHCPP